MKQMLDLIFTRLLSLSLFLHSSHEHRQEQFSWKQVKQKPITRMPFEISVDFNKCLQDFFLLRIYAKYPRGTDWFLAKDESLVALKFYSDKWFAHYFKKSLLKLLFH